MFPVWDESAGRRRPLDEWNWDELDLDLLLSWLERYPRTVAAAFAADPSTPLPLVSAIRGAVIDRRAE